MRTNEQIIFDVESRLTEITGEEFLILYEAFLRKAEDYCEAHALSTASRCCQYLEKLSDNYNNYTETLYLCCCSDIKIALNEFFEKTGLDEWSDTAQELNFAVTDDDIAIDFFKKYYVNLIPEQNRTDDSVAIWKRIDSLQREYNNDTKLFHALITSISQKSLPNFEHITTTPHIYEKNPFAGLQSNDEIKSSIFEDDPFSDWSVNQKIQKLVNSRKKKKNIGDIANHSTKTTKPKKNFFLTR